MTSFAMITITTLIGKRYIFRQTSGEGLPCRFRTQPAACRLLLSDTETPKGTTAGHIFILIIAIVVCMAMKDFRSFCMHPMASNRCLAACTISGAMRFRSTPVLSLAAERPVSFLPSQDGTASVAVQTLMPTTIRQKQSVSSRQLLNPIAPEPPSSAGLHPTWAHGALGKLSSQDSALASR